MSDSDQYVCPVDGSTQPSGFRGDLSRARITGHRKRCACGHVHTLDLVDGAWVVS